MAGVDHGPREWRQQGLPLPFALQGHAQAFWVHATSHANATPQAERDHLRRAVHQSILHTLAAHLRCAVPQLHIERKPGQAPTLWCDGRPEPRMHLSIAYAAPVALWVWSSHGTVGIDIQPVDVGGDVADWQGVAPLYLDAPAHQALEGLAGRAWLAAFAQQWTLLEARLKCAGLPLAEAPARAGGWCASIQSAALALPVAWTDKVAAVAWR